MNKKYFFEKIRKLNKKERQLLGFSLVIFVFFLIYILWIMPVATQKAASQELIEQMKGKNRLAAYRLDELESNYNNKYLVLKNKLKDLNSTIDVMKKSDSNFDPTDLWLRFLLQQRDGLNLVSMDGNIDEGKEHLRYENYQLHLKGRFVDLVEIIQDIETKASGLSITDLKYQVNTFPEADIYIGLKRLNLDTFSQPVYKTRQANDE